MNPHITTTSEKLHVAVLMGGPSWEHDISLKSGTMVLNHTDPLKYRLTPVVISRQGTWAIFDTTHTAGAAMTEFDRWLPNVPPLDAADALKTMQVMGIDICFNAMHGAFGEDGTIQGMLDGFGFAYTGSSVVASSVAMDKIIYKQLLRGAGIPVPEATFLFDPPDSIGLPALCATVVDKVGLPVVLKAPSSGSSIGVTICETREALADSIPAMYDLEGKVLFEQFITGREFTCAVLGNAHSSSLRALPVTEIITANHFFDFEAKYTPGVANEVTPAQIDDELSAHIQQRAVDVHNILDCKGMSRTDMLVSGSRIYVLETNTIPGMTPQSLLPQAAHAAGLTLEQLIDTIIEAGFDDFARKQQKTARAGRRGVTEH